MSALQLNDQTTPPTSLRQTHGQLQVTSRLVHMRSDVQAWLAQLEASYYTSAHKPPQHSSAQARVSGGELSQLAAEVSTASAAAQAAKASRQQ